MLGSLIIWGSSNPPKTPLSVAPGIKQFELQLASRTERDGNADGAGWRSADKLLVARLMPALSFLICRLSMQLGRVRSRMTTTRATTEPAGTTAGRPWGVAVYLYLCVLPVLCRIVLWFPIFLLSIADIFQFDDAQQEQKQQQQQRRGQRPYFPRAFLFPFF